MKKLILLIMLISLVLSLSGCAIKHVAIEQSQKNFLVYQESLQEIANKYGLELIEKEDKNIENPDLYKDSIIVVDPSSTIEIIVVNSAYKSKKGVEGFSIQYRISNLTSAKDYDIPLFVALVNSISGKKISIDFCAEFLNAPESKYSAEKYGYKKLNGEITSKQLPLNFFEDWNISYVLTKENEGILTFGGLTKQLSE